MQLAHVCLLSLCQVMRFSLRSVSQCGCRVGTLSCTRTVIDGENKEVETPMCTLYTKKGKHLQNLTCLLHWTVVPRAVMTDGTDIADINLCIELGT